ncbi:MAG: hypothetical protein KAY37_14065 [Phycisphaerae bacterium]|nr:hypothetical protein [Phycisphaerae bacterium]
MNLRTLRILVGLGALVVLTGCQNKFTKDRFEMITVGVDAREDVRLMIGEPTSDLHDQWFYDDLDHHYSCLIHFDEADRVCGKEWMDSVTGAWQGRNPNADEPPQGEVRQRHKTTRRIDED